MQPAEADKHYLELSIEIARKNIQQGNGGPFGAVIVREGKILAQSGNLVLADNDPTAHAEIEAIRKACRQEENFSLEGATIYCSSEPCPMCLGAIYWARIGRIVFSSGRQEAAAAGFDDAFLYREIALPIAERSIPTDQCKLPASEAVLKEWEHSENKVPY